MRQLRTWLLLAIVLMPGVSGAQTGASAGDEWEFTVTPFLWGIGLDGAVGIAARERDFEIGVSDLLESLDFGIMGNFEARRNRWSLSADVVYTDLSKDADVSTSNVAAEGARLDMTMTIFQADVGYEFVSSVDVLAGFRAIATTTGLASEQGTIGEVDGGFVDPMVGVRFRRDLSDRLWINLRTDVGGFGVGSDVSWFAGGAAGVRLSRHVSIDFGYRMWSFDYEGDDDLKRLDLTLAGFGAGVSFHF